MERGNDFADEVTRLVDRINMSGTAPVEAEFC